MKTSLVCTVLNEEKTINSFLESVFNQSKLPDEIIITDGGSTDNTISEISSFIFPQRKNVPNIKLLFKNGNRSVGRNEAIKKSTGDIILISDAGCVLDKNWVKNILAPFADKKIDVVAGYYKGAPKNIFEKCLVPYVLVMPDKINKNEFLPATRSMALRKSVWEKLKGFNEKLSHNEDYAFANKIKEKGFKIAFSKSAIVYWFPPKNIFNSFKMFFRFALGDAQARIFRDKVVFIFLRYIFAACLIFLIPIIKSSYYDLVLLITGLFYLAWSIQKNYKYVNNIKACLYLPILQLSSDLAVILGTSIGCFQSFSLKDCLNSIKNNKV
jgi:glycosyltransferase involved in cell wall biosynthesis